MPEIEKFVAVSEVEQSSADSVKADFGASRQEIGAYARGWLFDGLFIRTVWHGC
jgi:hypothetical protein